MQPWRFSCVKNIGITNNLYKGDFGYGIRIEKTVPLARKPAHRRCLGRIRRFFGVDPTVVRVVFVLGALLGFGSFVLLYIIMMFIVPEETGGSPSSLSVTPPPPPEPPQEG